MIYQGKKLRTSRVIGAALCALLLSSGGGVALGLWWAADAEARINEELIDCMGEFIDRSEHERARLEQRLARVEAEKAELEAAAARSRDLVFSETLRKVMDEGESVGGALPENVRIIEIYNPGQILREDQLEELVEQATRALEEGSRDR